MMAATMATPRTPCPTHPTPTPYEPRLAHVAAAVADATRARMLSFLMSGAWATAGELARAASVTPATASGHLQRLLDASLVVCEPRGRHRYYRLADDTVAHALEALALVAERHSHDATWAASPTRQRLRHARRCYGHLAGQMGVAWAGQLWQRGWLVTGPGGWVLSDAGHQGFQALGLPTATWPSPSPHQRWAFACMDWSERQDHLAGLLPRTFLTHALQEAWLRPIPGERALALTPLGQQRVGHLLAAPRP